MADHQLTSRPAPRSSTTSSKSATMADQLHMSKKWSDRSATSPQRTKVWTEPPPKLKSDKRVAVVYYLCRNGHLEHPHFIEVPLSTPDGLYLRDVINRLNSLRGKGMAALYSWSSKRSYKSGFVWHDLSENDFIYPAHGQEYVLKGSELVDEAALLSKSDETVSSRSEKHSPESKVSGDDPDFPVIRRRRNQSWSAIDLHEYKVYKSESTGESVGRAADASTQTDDKRRRRHAAIRDIDEEEEEEKNESTELSRGEISPPPSESSPETLESLMKADGRVVLLPELDEITVSNPAATGNVNQPTTTRLKASSVLMQLISCGSISFSDCGPGAYGKNHPGFSLISQYKARLPRGNGENQVGKGAGEDKVGSRSFIRVGKKNNNNNNDKMKVVGLEDKEYFSGSLIETKKDEFPALKRSSSYSADRSLKLELTEEIEGVRAKCIPRKPKTQSTRSTTTTATSTTIKCDSQQCSIVKI